MPASPLSSTSRPRPGARVGERLVEHGELALSADEDARGRSAYGDGLRRTVRLHSGVEPLDRG